ncbi:hypothetical protein [Flavobacterium covae]|uniref:hypothetical protein n=1 Tax=Flavobacterium covae TaxID=2906076 RepID=UPI000745ACB9|nr:hypothetical protein [Flavobacterium covae]AMA50639.1 hypothetical protein AWN65_05510 [Flavobacterium covae]MCJ1810149.1 hypothetical protein [Flavobacterium covae]
MRKIRIASEMVKELATEFKTSKPNVHASLGYYNNSELAMNIRHRAKEKLIEEANGIIIDKELNQ